MDIDTLDPPTDALNEETLAPKALAQNAPRLETIVELLNHPALTRVYVYICYWGPVSPPEVMDGLELSKSTTYELLDCSFRISLNSCRRRCRLRLFRC
jgi:hypothetical protein